MKCVTSPDHKKGGTQEWENVDWLARSIESKGFDWFIDTGGDQALEVDSCVWAPLSRNPPGYHRRRSVREGRR